MAERRAVLYFSDYTFDVQDLNEDMTQSSAVNPVGADADFAIGAACKSELKFNLNNLYQVISENSLAGKEFLLQRGKLTSETSVLDVYKKVRKPLFVQQGGFIFAASDRAPYLSIYNSDFVLQNTPEQPPQPVKSLFIVDSKLYCVHDKEPTMTAYGVSGGVLTMLPQITLTPFYQRKMVEEYAKHGRCFNKQGNTATEYKFLYENLQVNEVIAETWQYTNFGYYIVTDPEKINDTKISVLAYDRMQKFEVVADAFLDSVTYPIPLKSLLTKLCAFVGVTFNNKTLINENYSVPRNFKTTSVTCKQVLQWIAQITANFAYVDFDGKLTLSWYTDKDSPINPQNSTQIDIADYVVRPIEKVRARAFETDIGVPYPDVEKRNIYVIENNPLLYATKEEQILPAIINIFNAIKTFSYIPFTAKTYVVDETARAGMIIPTTTIKGTAFPAYVMQSTLKGVRGLTAEYSSTGNEYRKTQIDIVNQNIQVLNRRTNSLVFDLEKTENTLTTVKSEMASVTDDVTGITKDMEVITTSVGQLTLTSEQLAVNLSRTEQSLAGTNEKVASLEFSLEGFFINLEKGGLSFTDEGLIVSGVSSSIKIRNGVLDFFVDGVKCGTLLPTYSPTYGPQINILGKMGGMDVQSIAVGYINLNGNGLAKSTLNLQNGERVPIVTWH